MVTTPNYDLDVDTTLGGNNASDYIIPSQKAIKSYVDNNTGSTVDQTYDPTSQAAQSGVAINGAGFLKNTATGTNALTLLGTATNQSGSINIGYGSSVTNTDSVVIGESAQSAYAQTVAIGYQANANDTSSTAVGYKAYTNYQQTAAYGCDAQATAAGTAAIGSHSRATKTQATALGYGAKATANYTTAVGYNAQAEYAYGTAVGNGAISNYSGVAVGYGARADFGSVAVGNGAYTSAINTIQLGNGTNTTANSLQIGFGTTATNYQLLDGTTGLIPDARISSNIARTSAIPTIDQTFDGTSTNGQSGVSIIDLLDTLYPVGSIYIGTMATCPLATLGVGTWTLKSSGQVLQGSDANNTAGSSVSASLPQMTANSNGDHSHNRGTMDVTGGWVVRHAANSSSNQISTMSSGSGAISVSAGSGSSVASSLSYNGTNSKTDVATLKASDSWSGSTNTTGAHTHTVEWTGNVGTTVQPPAYIVNIWERTA